ncbi:MAG: ABC transporter transmembrane domain-containing protein, partial [Anaplasmataceae bacterium]|nr:ABC transporter transmembrane domain-containing protein [Anaplasmataceae bacterium]
MTTFKNIFNIIANKLTGKEKKWLIFLIIGAMISLIASKAALLYTPIIFKNILDTLNLSPNNLPLLLFIGYGMSRLANQIFSEIKDALSARMEFRVINVLGYNIFIHLHKLGLKFHLEKKSGEITRYTIRGTKALETFVRFAFFSIIPLIIEVILVGLYFLQYRVLYFIIILITIYLYFIVTLKLTEWRAKYFRSIKDVDNKASGFSVESILNYTTIKYFNNEERAFEQYKSISDNYEKVNIKNRNRMSCLGLAQSVVISSGITALITMAGYDIVHNLMQPSDIVLVTMYILQLSMPLFNLG